MKLISFIAPAAILVMSQLLITSCGSSSSSSGSEEDKVHLVPVTTSKDGKWSMVNSKGEIVYDSEFKNCPSVSYNGLFSVREGEGYTVYKSGGKNPEPVKDLENLKSVGFLEDGLLPVTFPNKRISVVDAKGKVKFDLNPIKGAEIIACRSFKEGMMWVKLDDGKWGAVDKSGKTVIQPIYDDVNPFSDGVAVVGKSVGEDSYGYNYSVIDKSGKELFKIKDGYELDTYKFRNGYLSAKKDERCYFINIKGEETKLSSKISRVIDYNGKYIIFQGEDGDYGVANNKDEILIRPKYEYLVFGNGDFFLAKKDYNDDELIKLNASGDEEARIDYEEICSYGKFGYFAKEGRTTVLLNNNFDKKGREEFFDVNLYLDNVFVYTDYFSAADIANTMVGLINGNKVGDYTLGEAASQVFKGKSPKDYRYTSTFEIEDLNKKGFRYEISVVGLFDESVADYDYDYYTHDWKYYWKSSAKLKSFIIAVLTENNNWQEAGGREAFKNALSSAGYKLIKEGSLSEDAYASVFKKGNVLVVAISETNGNLMIVDGSDSSVERDLLSSLGLEDFDDDANEPEEETIIDVVTEEEGVTEETF